MMRSMFICGGTLLLASVSTSVQAADGSACAVITPAGSGQQPLVFTSASCDVATASIRIGRDLDLSGQGPVRYANATTSSGARSYVLSTRGELADNVRLVGAPLQALRTGMRSGAMMAPSGMPVRSSAFTSGFGVREHPLLGGMRFHTGIDIAARAGEGVFATGAGRVTSAGWSGGYGLAVTIDHGNGLETRYAHLSRLGVEAGETVQAGELVGQVGSTGLSTGPHLHYELRRFGRPVDPAPALRKAPSRSERLARSERLEGQ